MTSALNTAKALGLAGFILVANPALGDLAAEPLPFTVPGIMIPKVSDAQVNMGREGLIVPRHASQLPNGCRFCWITTRGARVEAREGRRRGTAAGHRSGKGESPPSAGELPWWPGSHQEGRMSLTVE